MISTELNTHNKTYKIWGMTAHPLPSFCSFTHHRVFCRVIRLNNVNSKLIQTFLGNGHEGHSPPFCPALIVVPPCCPLLCVVVSMCVLSYRAMWQRPEGDVDRGPWSVIERVVTWQETSDFPFPSSVVTCSNVL